MPKPSSGPDLFSFDEPVASPKPAAAQDPFGSFETPAPQAAQGQGQGGFGDFRDSSGFGANFNGAQAAPPVDKKNDIMSMFNTQPQGQMGMGGGMGGGMGEGMGGAGVGGGANQRGAAEVDPAFFSSMESAIYLP